MPLRPRRATPPCAPPLRWSGRWTRWGCRRRSACSSALHQSERQINDAFDEARQSGDLQQQVSRVYKQMYRPD